MARKRTPLTSEKPIKSSDEKAQSALDMVHGEMKKKPGPRGFFSKWSEDDLTKLFATIPKDLKKKLKLRAINLDITEAQLIYEILEEELNS